MSVQKARVEKDFHHPPTRAEQVLLFVPNLIGYSRVAFTLASVYIALDDWKLSMACYLTSFILDFFDGFAARRLNQCE